MVCDAAWNLVARNALATALLGDDPTLTGRERNIAWRQFTRAPSRVRHSDEQAAKFEHDLVSDLRAATGRYPDDEGLAVLVGDLRAGSDRFETLWSQGGVRPHASARKTIEHPELGDITLDCDVLTVPDSDVRLVVYTAPAGSPEAQALALLGAVGLQTFAT
jgi:hypothetical protein